MGHVAEGVHQIASAGSIIRSAVHLVGVTVNSCVQLCVRGSFNYHSSWVACMASLSQELIVPFLSM